jgi:hypothetical protein
MRKKRKQNRNPKKNKITDLWPTQIGALPDTEELTDGGAKA